jgi:PST family polysaccharide transporter
MDDETAKAPLAGRTIRATAWLMAGVVYGRAVNVAMTVILARILVPQDFGLVALATTLLTIITAVTDLSLFNALIHHRDASARDYDTAFTLSAIRGALLAAIMVAGGFAMAAIYHDDRLVAVSAGLASRPLLSGFSSPYYVTFAKNLKFGVVARTEALNYTAQLVIAAGVALATHSYWAIVAGAVAASIANVVSAQVLAPYWPRFTLASWRKIMSFSIWMTFTQQIIAIGTRFDNFLVGGMLGVATFGAYRVAGNLASMATQSATVPLERVLFPSFATLRHDAARLRAAFQRAQDTLFAVGLPLGVGMALVADPLVYLLLGPRWGVSATVIEFIAPIYGVQMIFGPAYALAFSLGRTKALFVRSLILMSVRIPVAVAGLYFFGLYGLLLGRLACAVLDCTVNMLMIRMLIGLGNWQQLKATWRSLSAGAAMIAAVLVVRSQLPPIHHTLDAALWLAVLVPVGAVAYCAVHVGLWVLADRPDKAIEALVVKQASRLGQRYWPARAGSAS